MGKSVPDQFAELEIFVEQGWSLPTETARWRKRVTSDMDSIQAFYEGMLARMDEVIEFLDQHPLDDVPKEARPLFYLALAFMDISPAVEIFGTPDVPGCAFDISRIDVIEREYAWNQANA